MRIWYPFCGEPTGIAFRGGRNKTNNQPTKIMGTLAIVFAVLALIAAIFGFSGVAGQFAGIAKILLIVFIILAILGFFFGW